MKKIDNCGAILKFQKKLVEVVGYGDGRFIIMNVLKDEDKDKCPHCDKPIPTEFNIIESSPLFQGSVEAVETLKNFK